MKPSSQRLLLAYRWPLALLLSAAMISMSLMLGGWWFGRGVSNGVGQALDASDLAIEGLGAMVGEVASLTVTQSFVASLPRIADAGGGRLELASVERNETLRDVDTLSLFGESFSLGTSVAEIKVPVVYRYYIDLEEAWELDLQDGLCRVLAPRLRASLPPAIQTQHMEKKIENGWARFNGSQKMQELEKQLTPTLVQYAEEASLMILVKQQARKSLSRFVHQWLLQQPLGKDLASVGFVQIRFAGEEGGWGDVPAYVQPEPED